MQFQSVNSSRFIMAAAVSALSVLTMASQSQAGLTFVQLATPADATNNTGGAEGSSAIDGTTLYTIATGNNATNSVVPQITQITGLGTTPTDGTFISEQALVAGGGASTGLSGQLWNNGSNLEMYDSISGNVLRANKASATVAVYATKAEILAAATTANGSSQTSLLASATALTPTGDLAILDGSKGIYQTAGQDTAVTLLSPGTLASTTNGGPGTASITTFTIANNLVFLGVSSKGMYAYNTSNSTFVSGPVFTPAQIEAVTGNATTSFLGTASFYAPDGNVYFFDQSAKDIMVFNPASPLSTLSIAVSSAQINSIEGSTAVSNLTFYNNNIAWDNVNTVGQGVYAAVPEPTSLGLLTIATSGLLARRSRSLRRAK